ncbi:Aste57867_10999 [Aphanomyces stellatus]|uniref:glutathione transferase n=1 Tax=Aphanomyces stellatus TaxID=120398 RepID=A0A485KRR6_9STRA|nr:hypothetical protein As57867_010958 [Aphanomyces stellatus]VFT87867.1 Aste57867_10999 [Aphanomyces stellatus]
MPELGYWAIRGLAEPIRLLLVHTGTPFTDKRYELQGGPPERWSAAEWTSVKETMGMEFPNLPYFIDGDVKISQSNAILRYIATKHDLVGKTPVEMANCYQMQDVAMDLRNAMIKVFYAPQDAYEAMKESFLSTQLPAMLSRLETCTEKHGWFCGASLTFVDFALFELFDQLIRFSPKTMHKFPAILKFHAKFPHVSPQVEQYIASPKHTALAINNKMANFL